MAYPGGKDGSGVFQRLVNQIPPHDVFISAFLGDCSLMRRKLPAAVNVGVDLDGSTLSRFSAASAGRFDGELQLFCCDGIEWLRYAFDLERFNAAGGEAALVARFGVLAGRCFVYADPPYRLESRKGGKRLYRFEMSEEDHCRFLAVANRLPCLVMISHYGCDLYDEALEGWRSFEFQAWTRRGPATEKVWCNFEEPSELHDCRWLGGDKREREKYVRRRRNLMRRLRALPAVERQSILAELQGG